MMQPLRRLLLIAFTLTGLGLMAYPAGAHTAGKLQLSAVTAGDYQMSVWTSPDPAAAGEIHVALSVVTAQDAALVLDAAVMVEMTSLADGTRLSGPATTEDSENKFLYEAILAPDAPGGYLVAIQVNGVDGLSGDISFELEVVDASGFNLLLLIPIGLALAALLLVIGSRLGRASTKTTR